MTEQALAAGLCCARLAPPSKVLVGVVRPAVQAALDESIRLPPLGTVADLALLLAREGGSMVAVDVPGLPLRRYDDRVVGRWITDRRRTALVDGFLALSVSDRGLAVALLAERIAAEIEPDGPWWEPGAMRNWLSRPDEEAWGLALSALADPGVREALAKRVAHIARRPVAGFTSAHVHLVRHLPALSSRAQRVAVDQVMEAAALFDAEVPRRVRARTRSGPVVSAIHDEGRFPAGGFAGITTHGSPENLVASELVYMENGPHMDLFDVRYAEGELLYYTRDEAIHVRERRAIHVWLASDLVQARVKDPGLPYQRLVVALGALVTVLERVITWAGSADLRICVAVPDAALEPEARLVELVLKTWVDAGVLSVGRALPAVELGVQLDTVWMVVADGPPKDVVEPWVMTVAPASWPEWVRAATALARHLA